ncbi:PhzF family phenazine biosynthesis protein [Brevibacillus fluminis]|uniref:PhzF family phenazine biosynthesis protein n=1 Tax=Brevibacillus fluminis TaxID=511487 RepID=A0A3M8DC15_9BACL|nr:PhzF family phenazine biosynthesis protein [Brevibacillus fluminis]RNB84865.1 PhzF family phenazine biosynthesis protein [Brevibacillus fluminis]
MDFYFVDVFAKEKYQGNQLAVLVPDRELSTAEMQQIAREINFSEITYILSGKKENGGYDVRIFTPDSEIPFAGHPTLGTAYIINKIIERGVETKIILNLEVGQIPVSINGDNLIMSQNEPSFGMIIKETDVIANVLTIKQEDIRTDYPIQLVSTGLPCIIVPLKSVDAVMKCSINHNQFSHFTKNYYKCNLLVFSEEGESEFRARVFMDNTGFLEDPATGSANGNLAGYLLEYNFFSKNKIEYSVNQGYGVNRPSRINVMAEKTDGKFHIHVGGKVHLVAKGEWFIGGN